MTLEKLKRLIREHQVASNLAHEQPGTEAAAAAQAEMCRLASLIAPALEPQTTYREEGFEISRRSPIQIDVRRIVDLRDSPVVPKQGRSKSKGKG